MFDVSHPSASVTAGLLIDDGRRAALSFDVEGQALNLVVTVEQLVALTGVCGALSSQAQAERPDEVLVVPVTDWSLAATSAGSVLLKLASDSGGFCYHLAKDQAVDIQDAMGRALAAAARATDPVETTDLVRPADPPDALERLRRHCGDDPATLALINRCSDFLAQIEAANDEGLDILQENTAAFVDAMQARLLNNDAERDV